MLHKCQSHVDLSKTHAVAVFKAATIKPHL